jgi:hypothetical protein
MKINQNNQKVFKEIFWNLLFKNKILGKSEMVYFSSRIHVDELTKDLNNQYDV